MNNSSLSKILLSFFVLLLIACNTFAQKKDSLDYIRIGFFHSVDRNYTISKNPYVKGRWANGSGFDYYFKLNSRNTLKTGLYYLSKGGKFDFSNDTYGSVDFASGGIIRSNYSTKYLNLPFEYYGKVGNLLFFKSGIFFDVPIYSQYSLITTAGKETNYTFLLVKQGVWKVHPGITLGGGFEIPVKNTSIAILPQLYYSHQFTQFKRVYYGAKQSLVFAFAIAW